MSTQNSNSISVTGGSISGTTVSGYIPTTEKAVALGVATLDAGGTVPLSQIPASIQGGVSYQGTWNASTNTPTLTNGVGTKGYYYVVSVAGNTNLDGITSWNVGDWAIFNGTVWQKVDNTDAVTSVNGYTGTVVLTNTDISGFGTMSTQNANSVAITGGTINGTSIGATTASTGAFTTATASTSLTTPIVQASNSAGLALKNSAGTTQISMGAGGGDNASINVSTNINGVNAQIDISPTGTGHVHMKPTGTGAVEIAPTNVGTINNMTIGATTARAITGTTITATSFVGSGASLTNVVNSLTASTGISVSGSTGAVTVTNTAPDQTVALASGTGISVTGTYPNFTVTNTAPSSGGTVTSVTGTAPVVSSGGNTPAISIPAATTSADGYLTSTDWTTFNGKQATLVSGTNIKTINSNSILGSGDLTISASAAGSTTQVQYNNAGALAGSAGFVYDNTNGILNLSGSTGALTVPTGTTAERPATPVNGMTRYNTTLSSYEVYAGANAGWVNVASNTYAVSYLVVAGAGGGGKANGGGAGGAGGLRTALGFNLTPTTAYTVTVGAGGAGSSSAAGTSGSNSVFSSITSTGGGGGGGSDTGTGGAVDGLSGGSGGGAGSRTGALGVGGAGSSGQGFAGGNAASDNATYREGGGGGGSSAIGANATASGPGVGGAGTASSISGSSVTYAGGGGGGSFKNTTGAAGGSGGGGAGGGNAGGGTNGTSGTTNTGGGGGGAGIGTTSGGSGGSGIVIISYAGTQRGTGGTVTSAGGNTIHTFTSSGTYTA
jgi:hypothetical protein